MSKTGQGNYKGINSQAFAALSLFLQNVNKPDFKEMILEGENLEDFVLVYNSGKRIICESKYRTSGVGLHDLKSIIDTVLRNDQISDNDELLIISNNFHEKVKRLVNNYLFWTQNELLKMIESTPNFSDDQIALIPQIRLWEVGEEINRNGILFHMYQSLGSKNAFWIDKPTLEDWTNTLLIQDIYLKSESGEIIRKNDFLDSLEIKKNHFLENSGTDFEDVQKISLKKIESVVHLVNKNIPSKRDVNANAITELIANPILHYETLRRLGQSTDLLLSSWDILLSASVSGVYSFEIFNILKNNISNTENRNFIVKFLKKILEEYLLNYHQEDFLIKEIVEVCEKILETDSDYLKEVFRIVKKLFEYSSKIFFYTERHLPSRSWGREQVATFLNKIYSSDKIQLELREEVINFVFHSFNFIEDDGQFWNFTPPAIFSIASDYVNEDPKSRILEFSKIASVQNQKFLRRFSRKYKFDGWEHIGGGIFQSGAHISIDERHFVTKILQPALNLLPNNESKWDYVNQYFISRKISDVSFERPDFLNRSVIPYLFELYIGENHHEEAFEILSDFIKMRRGIPMKADIIYQELSNEKYTSKQKWDLIEVGLNEYKNLPVNIFVEKMMSDIALNSEPAIYQRKAIDILVSWSNNPKYQTNDPFGIRDLHIVFQLLNNPNTFDYGISILKTRFTDDNFIKSLDIHDSREVAKALAIVISKNFDEGIKILKIIESNEILSVNQQFLLFWSSENLETDNKGILLQIYNEFIDPLLSKYPSKEVFETRFSHSYAREGLVNFAIQLAKSKYFEQSISILERLVEDSDPKLEEQKDDLLEHNLHQKVINGEDVPIITSVRGNVAWALRYFSFLSAREYFAKALPLLRSLSEDENYYVRVQATYPLVEFMRNRDTYVVIGDKKERFVDESTSTEVSDIAFSMLHNKQNQSLPAVLKGLAHVFSYYKHMNHHQALEVINTLLFSDFEIVIRDASSLLLYFAEFRKNSFKEWPWGKLPEFDDTQLKNCILQQIKSGKENIRYLLSWEFLRLPKENLRDTEYYNKDLFQIAFSYFKEFVKCDYEKDIWRNIYIFIKDYLDNEFYPCINLWKSCVLKEKPYLTEEIKNKDKIQDLSWRPFSYNGKVLVSILKNLGEEEFIKWMEYLLDYPNEVLIAHDIEIAVSELSKLPGTVKRIEIVFNKLVERYPKYFDARSIWLNSRT